MQNVDFYYQTGVDVQCLLKVKDDFIDNSYDKYDTDYDHTRENYYEFYFEAEKISSNIQNAI